VAISHRTTARDRIQAGHRFVRLVVEDAHVVQYRGTRKATVVRCRCDCGTVKEIKADHLLSGRTIIDGCVF